MQSDLLVILLIPGIVGSVLMLLLMGPLGKSLVRWLKQRLGNKIMQWVEVISDYSEKELLAINAWSLLRYLVFSLQFLFLLWWTGLQAPFFLLLAAVAVTFLLKSLVPAFNFMSDLGVREFSALIIFSVLELPDAEVIAASLLLWIMNICLPALVGVLIVVQLKYKENQS